jgi:DNA-binding HxlR family transcriptional regulator
MIFNYVFNTTSEIIGGKWRLIVLFILKDGTERRFSEIRYSIPECSVKVLSQVLKDLEDKRVLVRTQYDGIPVKVTYRINEQMGDITPIINKIYFAFFSLMAHNQDIYPGPKNNSNRVEK